VLTAAAIGLMAALLRVPLQPQAWRRMAGL